jgi:ADP-heptose:LPS heptosyltransferase
MVNPLSEALLEDNPHVDEIIRIDTNDYSGLSGKVRLARVICTGRYDVMVCLNPNVPFAVAGIWGLVPVRISIMPNFAGTTFRCASHFFTYLEPHSTEQLITETFVRMLKGLDIGSRDISKEVYKSPDADNAAQKVTGTCALPLVGIAVSSGNKLKELGTDKLVQLINALQASMNVKIVLIGSHNDKKVASKIVAGTRDGKRIVDATGSLTLRQLPALLSRLALYIGVDTGITYMADAIGVPIIHLAGPIDTSEQRPVGRNVEIIRYELSCVPCTFVFKAAYECANGTRECIRRIDIRDIVNAAERMLGTKDRGR